MKKEIEKLLSSTNAFLKINKFCTVHRWQLDGLGEPVDHLEADFSFIASNDFSFSIVSRDYSGIVAEISSLQLKAAELIGEQLKREAANGYIDGSFNQISSGSVWTRDREAGNKIERFSSVAEANAAIKKYEEKDKLDGSYTPDFYEVFVENEN